MITTNKFKIKLIMLDELDKCSILYVIQKMRRPEIIKPNRTNKLFLNTLESMDGALVVNKFAPNNIVHKIQVISINKIIVPDFSLF